MIRIPNLASRSGQALVETALVMPLLILVAVISVWIYFLCHNLITLQQAASHVCQSLASQQDPRRTTGLLLRERIAVYLSLQGRVIPPLMPHSTALINEWKHTRSIIYSHDMGRIQSLSIESAFLPHFLLGRWLLPLRFSCHADTFMEAPVPEES